MIIEYSRTPTNTMRNMKNGRKKSTIAATTNVDEYISAVIPYPDSEDEQDDEQEYEQNEEQYEEQYDEQNVEQDN